MMLIIDACNDDRLRVVLAGSRHVWSRQTRARRRSDQLVRLIGQLMVAHRLTPGRLTGIVVVQGVTSFSSARISVAVANALAWAGQIPVASLVVVIGESDSELLQRARAVIDRARAGVYITPHYSGEPNVTRK